MNYSDFEKEIDIRFNDKTLLKQAFVHRSYINENKSKVANHNERLEFLGDAVLEMIVTDDLYKKFPNKNEGDLTAFRSALVNADTLSDLASELNMDKLLLLSKGEAKDRGKARRYILANTIEALIGAIYLDQGYNVATRFIEKILMPKLDSIISSGQWIDAKSKFQEIAQERIGVTPSYEVTKSYGPDHDRMFEIGVYLNDVKIAEGSGKSKQEAEQEAARHALEEKNWN